MRGFGLSSDFSGLSRVISAKSETVWNRRPGLVGLRLRTGIVSSRRSRCGRPRRERRLPASASGRVPNVPLLRLRLRLPLRLSVFTLVTFTPKIVLDGVLDLDLVRVRRDDERVDVLVEGCVRLLRHDGPDDDVAGVPAAHWSSPVSSASSTAGSSMGCSSTGSSMASIDGAGREPLDCSAERGLAEDEPVVDEHVVGVELVGQHELHAVDRGCGTTSRRPLRRGRAPGAPGRRARPSCAGPARPSTSRAVFVRGCSMPQSSTTSTWLSAARSDNAERSARRIIFLGVRWR